MGHSGSPAAQPALFKLTKRNYLSLCCYKPSQGRYHARGLPAILLPSGVPARQTARVGLLTSIFDIHNRLKVGGCTQIGIDNSGRTLSPLLHSGQPGIIIR